jgi:hypothetical protein
MRTSKRRVVPSSWHGFDPVLRSMAEPQADVLGLVRCPIQTRASHHLCTTWFPTWPAVGAADVANHVSSAQGTALRRSGRFLGSPKPAFSFSP